MKSVYITCIVLSTLMIGYHLGRRSHQNVNDLISVGFTVYDQDGYSVEKFDDGIYTEFPSYWTYVDKK